MARPRVLTDQEREIGCRLRYLRAERRLSRADLALHAGVSVGEILRIETGKRRLSYFTATKLLPPLDSGELGKSVPVNPLWLAEGGFHAQRLNHPLPLPRLPLYGFRNVDAFSAFVAEHRELLMGLAKDEPDGHMSSAWVAAYATWYAEEVRRAFTIANECVTIWPVFEASLEGAHPIICELVEATRDRLLTLPDAYGPFWPGGKKELTQIAEIRNAPGVPAKSELERLLDEARALCEAPGRKLELSRALEVAPSSVSDWFAGRCQPNGDTSLRLFKWVRGQSGTTNEPASGATPAGPKSTRSNPHRKHEEK